MRKCVCQHTILQVAECAIVQDRMGNKSKESTDSWWLVKIPTRPGMVPMISCAGYLAPLLRSCTDMPTSFIDLLFIHIHEGMVYELLNVCPSDWCLKTGGGSAYFINCKYSSDGRALGMLPRAGQINSRTRKIFHQLPHCQCFPCFFHNTFPPYYFYVVQASAPYIPGSTPPGTFFRCGHGKEIQSVVWHIGRWAEGKCRQYRYRIA